MAEGSSEQAQQLDDDETRNPPISGPVPKIADVSDDASSGTRIKDRILADLSSVDFETLPRDRLRALWRAVDTPRSAAKERILADIQALDFATLPQERVQEISAAVEGANNNGIIAAIQRAPDATSKAIQWAKDVWASRPTDPGIRREAFARLEDVALYYVQDIVWRGAVISRKREMTHIEQVHVDEAVRGYKQGPPPSIWSGLLLTMGGAFISGSLALTFSPPPDTAMNPATAGALAWAFSLAATLVFVLAVRMSFAGRS